MTTEPKYTYSEELFSDLHKDAYGYRPKEAAWAAWDAMTPDMKQAFWERMIKVIEESEAARAVAEATAVAAFDALPLEERQAILVREMKGTGDPDFACYNLGLPYHHLDEMAKALPPSKE